MPPAKPPLAPLPPYPLREDEAEAVKEIVRHFYGEDAVIRSYGPDTKVLALHVETSRPDAVGKSIESPYHDCLGLLLRDIARQRITLEVTLKGSTPVGLTKIAYRQGTII